MLVCRRWRDTFRTPHVALSSRDKNPVNNNQCELISCECCHLQQCGARESWHLKLPVVAEGDVMEGEGGVVEIGDGAPRMAELM